MLRKSPELGRILLKAHTRLQGSATAGEPATPRSRRYSHTFKSLAIRHPYLRTPSPSMGEPLTVWAVPDLREAESGLPAVISKFPLKFLARPA